MNISIRCARLCTLVNDLKAVKHGLCTETPTPSGAASFLELYARASAFPADERELTRVNGVLDAAAAFIESHRAELTRLVDSWVGHQLPFILTTARNIPLIPHGNDEFVEDADRVVSLLLWVAAVLPWLSADMRAQAEGVIPLVGLEMTLAPDAFLCVVSHVKDRREYESPNGMDPFVGQYLNAIESCVELIAEDIADEPPSAGALEILESCLKQLGDTDS